MLKCFFKFGLVYEGNRIVNYVWRCPNQLNGQNLSINKFCYNSNCRGRRTFAPSFGIDFSPSTLNELLDVEMLKYREGVCGNLECTEYPSMGKYCSSKCRETSISRQLGVQEKMGRKKINIVLNCTLCNEELIRKPWQIRQNKTGLFFCCKAHQESYLLKNQGQRSDLRRSFIEKKSKRDK